jgi:hypothetical protein
MTAPRFRRSVVTSGPRPAATGHPFNPRSLPFTPEAQPRPKETTKETKTYPPNIQHSEGYYLRVLLLFIEGLKASATHAQIAARLNADNLKTPTGRDWTAEAVKQALKRVRLHREYRSAFHAALMRLVYSGDLTVAQTQILFAMRTTGVF